MGRLFWKFFAFSWLAQLAGIFAIAITFWLTEPDVNRAFNTFDHGPGNGAPLDAAPAMPYAGPGGPPLPRGGPWLGGPGPGGLGPGQGGMRPPPRLAPTIGTLLASLATALGLAWYVAKPIRSLRTAFDAVAGGNLGVRVAPLIGDRSDELADLGRDFDRMAERLRASMEAQQRLLHDVSHEMRSPLARLQAATGRIRQRYGQEEPMVERIEEEIVRIDKLVGDLLELSRLEAGEHAGAVEDIDMLELLREVVADANFEAHAGNRTVTLATEAGGIVSGRPDLLQGAIENVIRNALKHAPDSPDVRVEAEVDPVRRVYSVRVFDSGPGVPAEELPALFTPFFRAADAARKDGYGLGLAIARRSVEAHHGSIDARNRPEGGLLITIDVPLA